MMDNLPAVQGIGKNRIVPVGIRDVYTGKFVVRDVYWCRIVWIWCLQDIK